MTLTLGSSLQLPVREALAVLDEHDRAGELADREYESSGAADDAYSEWERVTADALERLFRDNTITNSFRSGMNVRGAGRRASAMFADRRAKLLELQAELLLLDLNDHRAERLEAARQMQSEDGVLLIEAADADKLFTRQIRNGETLVANAPVPQAMSDAAFRTVEDQEGTFRTYNLQLLRTLFDRNAVAESFDKLTTPFEYRVVGRRIDWHNLREIDINSGTDPKEVVIERIRRQVNELTRLRGTLSTIPRIGRAPSNSSRTRRSVMSSKKVFVVHGHAPGLRAEVARLIEHFGLEPVILAEQPNAGATLIEKLLANADVSFAIVLATADDVGAPKQRATTTQARARQNVVFELGFFVGRLGRDRVALLVENGLEIFSDFHGVVYHALDQNGAWKLSLAKELKAAGLDVDLNRL